MPELRCFSWGGGSLSSLLSFCELSTCFLGRNGRCFCSRAWCSPSQHRHWQSADKLVQLQTAFETGECHRMLRLTLDCHFQISERSSQRSVALIHSFIHSADFGWVPTGANTELPKCLLLWGVTLWGPLQILWRCRQLAENPIPF